MKHKPAVGINTESMWGYKYQAKEGMEDGTVVDGSSIVASDSLSKLKAEVKRLGWPLAWITCKEDRFSFGQRVGQRVVDEYSYIPRYKQTSE